jgi:hypothetical protein
LPRTEAAGGGTDEIHTLNMTDMTKVEETSNNDHAC